MRLTIGQLAASAEVRIDTVRHYERTGLLKPAHRNGAGYRIYGKDAVRRLRFIRKAQRLGFTLAEIGRLLYFGSSPESTAGDIYDLAQRKIDEQQARIAELTELCEVLDRLAEECGGEGSTEECPILNYLSDPGSGPAGRLVSGR